MMVLRLATIIITALGIVFLSEPVLGQKKKEARIQYKAETVEVNKSIKKGAQRLLGNVEFTHEGAIMYCDSAYFYTKTNSLDAFYNIVINQGDTLFLYGDFLHYNGNSKRATVTDNVKLVDEETTLTTDTLDYELNTGVAYYTNYAKTVNKENIIESIKGFYYSRRKSVVFHDSVIITNPDYVMYSDTAEYNTESGIASFLGPTDIIGDSSHIYGEKGWYDTELDLAELEVNAWAKNKNQTIFGQYIFYDKSTGDGIARDRVSILEEEQNILLLGNTAKYNDITEYAFLTDSAQFIQFSSKGDSLYLHADSIISVPDSAGNKMIFAYYGVRFYRENIQGKCDSMAYSFADSTIRLFYDPVLWSGKHQISADLIEILTKNQQIEKMYLHNSSFITSEKDTAFFDQIKGKNMICHFSNGQLHLVDVNGNGQTVYFPLDEEEIAGVNLSECSNLKIFLIDGEVHHINFYVNPSGAMYPLDMAPENKLQLKGFNWQKEIRPKSRYDIF